MKHILEDSEIRSLLAQLRWSKPEVAADILGMSRRDYWIQEGILSYGKITERGQMMMRLASGGWDYNQNLVERRLEEITAWAREGFDESDFKPVPRSWKFWKRR